MPNEIAYHMEQNANFTPDYTVVVRLTFEATNTSLEITLSDAEIHSETDIKKFLKALVKDPPPKPSGTKAPDPAREHPLGIPVDAPTNVVIVLDPKKDWQFRDGKPAITAKGDYGDDNYGSWHVDAVGNALMDFPEECKIAYFSVVRRPPDGQPNAIQRFNLHLEFLQKDKRWAEIIIDPDVPETGSEGFPPGKSKMRVGSFLRTNSVVISL